MSDQEYIPAEPNQEALCQAYATLVGIYHDHFSHILDAETANQKIHDTLGLMTQLREQDNSPNPRRDALRFSDSASAQCDLHLTREENLAKARHNFGMTYAYVTGISFLPHITGVTDISAAARRARLGIDSQYEAPMDIASEEPTSPGQLQAIVDTHLERGQYASKGTTMSAKESMARYMAAGGNQKARAENEIKQLRTLNNIILPATDEWVFLFDGIYRAAFASVLAKEELPVTSPQAMAAALPAGTLQMFTEHLLCRAEDVALAYDHTLRRAIADAKAAQERGHQRPDIEDIAQNRLEIANVCQRKSLRRQVQLYNERQALEMERGSGRYSTTR